MDKIAIYLVDSYLLSRLTLKRYFKMYENCIVVGDFSHLSFCVEQMKIRQADLILLSSDLIDSEEISILKHLKQEFPAVKIIVKTFQKDKSKILELICAGISGFITDEDLDLKKVIDAAMKGNFLMDSKIAKYIFSAVSDINFENDEILNENKKMKNSLTQREMEVLKLITEGKTNSQIAKEIIISTNTAKAHVGSILTKLDVTDRVQAAVKAVRARLF